MTGLSGSGKSTARNILEDIGFFCLDNLPYFMLPHFLQSFKEHSALPDRIALVMDVRTPGFVENFPEILHMISDSGFDPKILFLHASDSSLIKRYRVTRRVHPLAGEGDLEEGIAKERKLMQPIVKEADLLIDTSHLSIYQFKEILMDKFRTDAEAKRLSVRVISFGFESDVPEEADLLFDVRFLPNPFFVNGLRDRTGLDEEVVDYIMSYELAKDFLRKIADLLSFLLPNYEKEGKAYLTIGVGCTGGRHRSVTMANKIAEIISGIGYSVKVKHRDIKPEA